MPRDFLGGDLSHRTDTWYPVTDGVAVYFDTGVIEVATPLIELERGCVARAGGSLWESIGLVRQGLDGWERRHGRTTRMVGFSTHYNVSIEGRRSARSLDSLAKLLTYILPAPVMLRRARRCAGAGR